MSNSSEINLKINLDANKVPEKMEWKATDLANEYEEIKALLLSMWDPKENNSLRIDLWTKEMNTDEMKFFFHQTLLTMADTYERSTGDNQLAEDLRDFCFYFAKQTKIIKEKE